MFRPKPKTGYQPSGYQGLLYTGYHDLSPPGFKPFNWILRNERHIRLAIERLALRPGGRTRGRESNLEQYLRSHPHKIYIRSAKQKPP